MLFIMQLKLTFGTWCVIYLFFEFNFIFEQCKVAQHQLRFVTIESWLQTSISTYPIEGSCLAVVVDLLT